ncbi:membrane dipeptidase, partial [Streptomyces afghaniensis]|uniref:membrane dipeptidase n=1 Tax=Streptomyces afghaniensis TaxID=66865 RepID=UPI003CC8C9C4
MNRLGMLVDLSHVGRDDHARRARRRARPGDPCPTPRHGPCATPAQVPDDVLGAAARQRGMAMVTFVPKFVLQAAVDWTAEADENMRATASTPRHHRGAM